MGNVYTFTLQVPVNYDLGWVEMVRNLGKKISMGLHVASIGDRFPTEKTGVIVEDLTVVNFDEYESLMSIQIYAQKHEILPAHPRVLFAIAEHYPMLSYKRGLPHMEFISPCICKIEHSERVLVLWCDEDGRCSINLSLKPGRFPADRWFVFSGSKP